MDGFIDQVFEIRARVASQNVSTGYLETWESLGFFYGCISERVSSLSSYQQQFSRQSLFTVRLADGPQLSFGKTLIYATWKGQQLVLEPAREAKHYGDSYRQDQQIECVNIYGMTHPEIVDDTPSTVFPPTNDTLDTDTFAGDGATKTFSLSFVMAPSTSRVIVDSVYQVRGVNYYEYSDRIEFIKAPEDETVITVNGTVLES